MWSCHCRCRGRFCCYPTFAFCSQPFSSLSLFFLSCATLLDFGCSFPLPTSLTSKKKRKLKLSFHNCRLTAASDLQYSHKSRFKIKFLSSKSPLRDLSSRLGRALFSSRGLLLLLTSKLFVCYGQSAFVLFLSCITSTLPAGPR